MKSERMSGSQAIAIWMMANEKTSGEKNVMEKVLEAMEDTWVIEKGKVTMVITSMMIDVVEWGA